MFLVLVVCSFVAENLVTADENTFFKNLLKNVGKQLGKAPVVVLIKYSMYRESQKDVDDIYRLVIEDVSEENILLLPNPLKLCKDDKMMKGDVFFLVSDAFQIVS